MGYVCMGAAIQGLALSSVGANGPLKATRVGVQGAGGSIPGIA